MSARASRLVGIAAVLALAVWWGRALAHSKLPPPEGRWREIDLDGP
ncbi:MAG: hypothetical protein ACRDJJ_02180 [Actinomycetota bacterium]